jgi:hypothetical protein
MAIPAGPALGPSAMGVSVLPVARSIGVTEFDV